MVLARGLVATGVRAVRAGDPGPLVAHQLSNMACFRAVRDGLMAQAVDVRTARLTTPIERLSALPWHVREELATLPPGGRSRTCG
ncbi:hypothetical protein [Actinocrispum sp. NPDC049592]|uniref:hypothetical protein n=1 Tax=Actinocrispum sp. NPDC049592 TaxID=3154835 RepID=UPI00342FFC5B